jgi:hypothetical protein
VLRVLCSRSSTACKDSRSSAGNTGLDKL